MWEGVDGASRDRTTEPGGGGGVCWERIEEDSRAEKGARLL